MEHQCHCVVLFYLEDAGELVAVRQTLVEVVDQDTGIVSKIAFALDFVGLLDLVEIPPIALMLVAEEVVFFRHYLYLDSSWIFFRPLHTGVISLLALTLSRIFMQRSSTSQMSVG